MDLPPVTAVGLLCPSLALLYAVGASFARHRLSGGTGSEIRAGLRLGR